MTNITTDNCADFIKSKSFVLIYFDAPWSTYTELRQQFEKTAKEAEMNPNFAFGEINLQTQPALHLFVHATNVPGVAYFSDGKLFRTVIGLNQDIKNTITEMIFSSRAGPFIRKANRI